MGFDSQNVQPVASRYNDYAILVQSHHMVYIMNKNSIQEEN
jgi:hypothetical protein